MTTLKPDQKVALVTGAGRNIGRAIAHALSKQGFALAINVRASVSEGQAVVDELLALGTPAILCVADVTDRHSVQGMMDLIESNWGRLDVVVNNAAIRREAPLEQVSVEDWRNTLAVVLDGAFIAVKPRCPCCACRPWVPSSTLAV